MQFNLGEFIFYKFKILDWKIKKNKIIEICEKSNLRKYGNVMTDWNTSIQNKNKLKKEIYDLLFDEINLFKNTLKDDYTIDSAWFQEYDYGMSHEIHNHGIGYSSVIYINYDSKYHKSTAFFSKINEKTYYLDVEEGDIIFFNSKYDHYCPKNESKVKRMICAFNLKKILNLTYN